MEELNRLCEPAYARYFHARQHAILRRPGNPAGIVIEETNGAILFASLKRSSIDYMNRALILESPNDSLLDRIRSFYSDRKLPVRFEIAEPLVSNELRKRFFDFGLKETGSLTVVHRDVSSSPPPPREVMARRIFREELPSFGDVYVAGFELRAPLDEFTRSDVETWLDIPYWSLYLALVNETPAGAAVLAAYDAVAYLGSASTLPEFRRRGVHTALLARRITDAAVAGCSTVFARVSDPSASFESMLRIGFTPAYRKLWWEAAG